jgi:hypothetical protein
MGIKLAVFIREKRNLVKLLSRIFKDKVKVKIKLSLCFFLTEHHAMKAYWGSGDMAPLIL